MGGKHARAYRPAQHSAPQPPEVLTSAEYPHVELPGRDCVGFADATGSSPDTREPASAPSTRPGRGGDPVLPTRAAEDTPEAWGEQPDSNDRRLRDNVPPHW